MRYRAVSGGTSGAVSGAMNTAGQLGSFVSAVAFGYLVEGLLVVGGVAFGSVNPRRRIGLATGAT